MAIFDHPDNHHDIRVMHGMDLGEILHEQLRIETLQKARQEAFDIIEDDDDEDRRDCKKGL